MKKEFVFLGLLGFVVLTSSCCLRNTNGSSANEVKTDVVALGEEKMSVKQLETIFCSLEKRESSALKNNGFALVDTQSRTVNEEYDDSEETEEVTYIKEVYSINFTDGFMTLVNVYRAKVDYPDTSVEIVCDTETWNRLRSEAKASFKDFSDGLYLSECAYFTFKIKGIITITSESSVSWPRGNSPLKYSDLMNLYNNRKDENFINKQLASLGYSPSEDCWEGDGLMISVNTQRVRIEATSEDGDNPFPQSWYDDIDNAYKEEDSSVGMVIRTDYHKQGMPIISIGCVFQSWVFSIGETANM